MPYNPYDFRVVPQNDLDSFQMPYKLYGRTDLDNMINKYLKLDNRSRGTIVRLYKW